jgi:hypothetical protein
MNDLLGQPAVDCVGVTNGENGGLHRVRRLPIKKQAHPIPSWLGNAVRFHCEIRLAHRFAQANNVRPFPHELQESSSSPDNRFRAQLGSASYEPLLICMVTVADVTQSSRQREAKFQ